MSSEKRSTTDQILDLLLDALMERQKARQNGPVEEIETSLTPETGPTSTIEDSMPIEKLKVREVIEALPVSDLADEPAQLDELPDSLTPNPQPLQVAPPPITHHLPPNPPAPLPTINLNRMLARLAMVLVGLIVLVNIPFNSYGTSLARALPDQKALIIRDGLVLKGSGPEFYVLENNQRRWISSLDAFEYYGYQWGQVNEVEDAFLERFPEGKPVHLLMKCSSSPHVYAFENGAKRWIKDIPTFTAQNYVWEEIQFVDCRYLRNLPDGLPIPEDAGEPPQP